MAKVKRHRKKGSQQLINQVKAQRGLDREAHFEAGGTLVEWMGGPRTKTKNLKAWKNKRAARKAVQL